MKLETQFSIFFGSLAVKLRRSLGFLLFFVVFGLTAQTYTVSTAAASGGDADAAETASGETQNPGKFIISRSEPVIPEVTVYYTVTTGIGAATASSDYVELTGSVTFNYFQNSQEVPVNVLDDQVVENNETVTITLTSASQGTVDTTPATVTISDDTDVGILTLDIVDSVATEEGGVQARFELSLDKQNGTGEPLVIPYTLGGTASDTEGADYTLSGEFSFEDGTGPGGRNLFITPVDDALVEEEETVILTLGAIPDNFSGLFEFNPAQPTPVAERTISIADNDCAAGNTAPAINDNAKEFCNPPNADVNLDTFVTGGVGSAPTGSTLRWSTNANPTAESDLLPNATATAGTYYAVYVSESDACFSPVSEAVEVTFNTAPSVGTVITPITACSNESDEFGPNIIDLDEQLQGADDGSWEQTSGPDLGNLPGNNEIDFEGAAEDSYEFTYTTNTAIPPCANATAVVTITVSDCDPCVAGNTAPTLKEGVETTICGPIPDTLSLNDFTSSTAPEGTTLEWTTNQDDPTDTQAHLNDDQINDPLSGTYYAFFYDAVNECASPLLTVNFIQRDIPEITVKTPNQICGPGTVQLSATATLDATIRWYTVATGGSPVQNGDNFTTPNLTQTTSYFVEATSNGCTSARTEVVATVLPPPSAGAPQNTSSCSDTQFGATDLDLDDTFSETPDEGVWSFTDGPSAISLDAENVVDFQGGDNGDYVFTYTTNGAEAPCEDVSATVTVSVSSCDTDDDGDGLLGGLEATLGTDPQKADTDGDAINDGVEVGDDPENPLDEDEDGTIDALDSDTVDTDGDTINDQQDPANDNACVPNRLNGLCDTDGDGVSDLDEDITGSDPDDPCDPNATPSCADPIDLEVLKVVEGEQLDAVVGEAVVFTITVNNLSDRKAINVMVEDTLNTGYRIDTTATITASNGEYSVAEGMWTIPEIAAMGSETLTIPVTVIEGGPYKNTAELLSSIP
ncbi:MAG TPA: Calx-beta domain-containing protein, partial [Pricia sp.]|nr:Calx-beta domain-containing protein [Pricia sp.]